MKSKFLLTGTLFITFFLTGCGSFTTEADKNTSLDPAGQTFNDSTFQDAVSSLNKNLCTYLEDEKLEQECIDTIDAELLTNQALEAIDKSLCKEITLEKYKAVCEEKLDFVIDEEEKRAKEEEKNAEEVAKKRAIIDKDDLKACEDLTAPHNFTCRFDIINNRATAAQDLKICEELKETEPVDLCKGNVNAATSEQEAQT